MLNHGDIKELTVIKETVGLGSSFVKLGSVIIGWWDKHADYGEGKWKIDYGNGFVGWWDDNYFHYEGKGVLYKTNAMKYIISPMELFYGAVICCRLQYWSVASINGDQIALEPYSVQAIQIIGGSL